AGASLWWHGGVGGRFETTLFRLSWPDAVASDTSSSSMAATPTRRSRASQSCARVRVAYRPTPRTSESNGGRYKCSLDPAIRGTVPLGCAGRAVLVGATARPGDVRPRRRLLRQERR